METHKACFLTKREQAFLCNAILKALHKKSTGAPKARNMKARGKREAKRSASSLGYIIKFVEP
jgi:hypothetical protein